MFRLLVFVPLLFLFTACNSYNLRYRANPQPGGANIFADYTTLQDAIGVSIDTDGRRLEEAFIVKADGTRISPLNIQYPAFGQSASIGTGIGFGTGPVGIGTGVGIPIGPSRARGVTTATFSAGALGAPPWPLHVKLQGVQKAVVQLGGPPNAK